MIANQMRLAKKTWEFGLGRSILAVFFVHSVSISIGICQGYSAVLLPQLHQWGEYELDAEQMSWIASLGVVANPFGSILSGVLADYAGRKLAIQLSAVPFVVGWLCIAFASSLRLLCAGRLVTGVAAGMSTACYTYVSEVSEPRHRGLFQALGPVCASFGILFIYLLGTFVHWQTAALASAAFAVFSAVGVRFVPESPAHLIARPAGGGGRAAFEALLWFRRSSAQAQLECQALRAAARARAPGASAWANARAYVAPSALKPFAVMVALFLLQSACGIYAILFYAVHFFREAELAVDEHAASVAVALIRFGMSVLAAFLVSRFNRRALCMASAGGMALSLGAVLLVPAQPGARLPQTFRLACLLLSVLFSTAGMLPIPWILVGEVFPLAVRCAMSGLVICIAQCFIFLSVKAYPQLSARLSFRTTIGIFGACSLLALLFARFCLPETKNRTLEEIERCFGGSLLDAASPAAPAGGDQSRGEDGATAPPVCAGAVNRAFEGDAHCEYERRTSIYS